MQAASNAGGPSPGCGAAVTEQRHLLAPLASDQPSRRNMRLGYADIERVAFFRYWKFLTGKSADKVRTPRHQTMRTGTLPKRK